MSAGKYNIQIEQGATFSLPITYRDSDGNLVDLTTYTAAMHIRRSAAASDIVATLSTENYRIELGGVAGTIDLSMLSDDTAALPGGDFVYDLKLRPSGGVATRLIEGKCSIVPQVTRDE